MQGYTTLFLRPIKESKIDNTYKLAWARAIVECSVNSDFEKKDNMIYISEYDLSRKLLKYYWNQIGYFNLYQGSNHTMRNIILEVKKTFDNNSTKQTLWFDKTEVIIKRNPIIYEKLIGKIIAFIEKHLLSKYERLKDEQIDLYEFHQESRSLQFKENDIMNLIENKDIINDVIDLAWAKVVDNYNETPNILFKVVDSKQDSIHKKPLTQVKKILVEHCHLEGLKDFFTNESLPLDDACLLHLFPYDFVYDNYIWNIVIIKKGSVDMKQRYLPTKEDIEKLMKRNQKLYKCIKNSKLRIKNVLQYEQQHRLISSYYEMFKIKN